MALRKYMLIPVVLFVLTSLALPRNILSERDFDETVSGTPGRAITGVSPDYRASSGNELGFVPDRVSGAYEEKEQRESELQNVITDPSEMVGGALAYDNHSSSYVLNSGDDVNINHVDMDINGSLQVSGGTRAVLENISLYFNFKGTDPYITVDSASLLMKNVTVDSDVPVRLYGFDSNITFDNCFFKEVTGNDIVLTNFHMYSSYIARLTNVMTFDRSTAVISDCHINGTRDGYPDFDNSELSITGTTFSRIHGVSIRYGSTGRLDNDLFYGTYKAVSYNMEGFMGNNTIYILNSSFLDNEMDVADFNTDVYITGCLFANSSDATIGYDGDGRWEEKRDDADERLPQSPPQPTFSLDNNIFYNTSHLNFTSFKVRLYENILYDAREGFYLYNCEMYSEGDRFRHGGPNVNANSYVRTATHIRDAAFSNWYLPVYLTDSDLFLEDTTFVDCYFGVRTEHNHLFETTLTNTSFLNCTQPIKLEGGGYPVVISNIRIENSTHAIDVFDVDVNIEDGVVRTEDWNIKMEHTRVNTTNVSFTLNKINMVEDCELYRFAEVTLLVEDYANESLSGVPVEIAEVNGGPSYIHISDENGKIEADVLNYTEMPEKITKYSSYLLRHESERWGYLRKEFAVQNGMVLIANVGFSDLRIVNISHTPDEPYDNTEVVSEVNITNSGRMPARNVTVTFDLNYGEEIERTIPLINYSEHVELRFLWKAEVGGQYVEVEIDPDDVIFESNESDNYRKSYIRTKPRPKVPAASLVIDPNPAYVGDPVTFNASSSEVHTTEAKYIFYFGDGTRTNWTNGSVVLHRYNESGSYFPTVKVKDELGQVSENSSGQMLRVTAPPPPPKRPVAAITYFYTPRATPITVESTFTLSSASSYSPDDAIVNTTWTIESDHTERTIEGGLDPVTHRFKDDRNYRITLIVTDSRGIGSEPAHLNVKVNNLPPSVMAKSNATRVIAGESVSFSADGTTDPDDDLILDLTYRWIIDDDGPSSQILDGNISGNGAGNGAGNGTGNGTGVEIIGRGRHITHAFDETGEYEVRLAVTDDDNSTEISDIIRMIVREGDHGESEDEGGDARALLKKYRIWVISLAVVLIFGIFTFARSRGQEKRAEYDKLISEQELLTDKIRKKEIEREYQEAKRKTKERISKGDVVDFTVDDDEVEKRDAEIDYFGLEDIVDPGPLNVDQVVEYREDDRFGRGRVGGEGRNEELGGRGEWDEEYRSEFSDGEEWRGESEREYYEGGWEEEYGDDDEWDDRYEGDYDEDEEWDGEDERKFAGNEEWEDQYEREYDDDNWDGEEEREYDDEGGDDGWGEEEYGDDDEWEGE